MPVILVVIAPAATRPHHDVPVGLDIHFRSGTRIDAKLDHPPATFTILNSVVQDFEHYETPKTDAKGIHRTPEVRLVAWFRDPAGDLLPLIQEIPA